MVEYDVKLLPRARRDLDDIYTYIAATICEPGTAETLVDELEEAILSLSTFPKRGAERKVGAYAGKGYRQLFVKNYTIIYRAEDVTREVFVVTVRYTPSQF